MAIARNAGKYPVKAMCEFFGVSRSGYYAFTKRSGAPDKDAYLAELIRQCQEEVYETYGYRRVGIWLKRQGVQVNHKAVLRIMNKYGLLAQIRRRKKYRQMSDQMHRYPNILKRLYGHKAKPEMGNGYLLYSDPSGNSVSVYDSRPF